ncbi:metallophosphoesterase [Zymobacter sp. IVIA_12111.31 C1]|uniref:metallophosphoesterase n=1 Tax=Zymobacter sp. IVIA_12111.31 C1 TaxID=3394854 RepID=UPI0039C39EEB
MIEALKVVGYAALSLAASFAFAAAVEGKPKAAADLEKEVLRRKRRERHSFKPPPPKPTKDSVMTKQQRPDVGSLSKSDKPAITSVKKFGINHDGTDYVVGDIHGCLDMLNACLEKVGFNKEKDRLFSVGDLIDRGPNSKECLQLVYEPWFHAVMGNHESMALGALKGNGPAADCWIGNGGLWALVDDDPTECRNLINDAAGSLPLFIEVETSKGAAGIMHADPLSEWKTDGLTDHERMQVIWGRSRIDRRDTSLVEGIDIVIVGHTPTKCIEWLGNVRYLDLGGVFNGKMAVVPIEDLF